MNCLFRYISLRNGTTLFQFIMFLLIVGLLISVMEINGWLMDKLINEICEQLLQKSNFQQFEIQAELFKNQATFPLLSGFQLLQKINIIHKKISPFVKQFEQPYICPSIQSNYSLNESVLQRTSQFCIYYKNLDNAEDAQDLFSYISVLNQLMIPIISYELLTIHFTNLLSDYCFAALPFVYNSSFNPQIRPWYTNHLNQIQLNNQSQSITDAYQIYGSDQYQFTLTQSLENNNNQLQGVLAYDLRFSIYQQYLFKLNFTYFFLTKKGLIINSNQLNYSNSNLINKQIYFYYQNETGFSLQDWQQILNQLNNLEYINNCEININHLCRYNEKYHEDIILHIINIGDQFLFILYQNLSVQYEYRQQFQTKKINILNNFRWKLVYFNTTSFFLLFCTWTGMYLFFRPIQKLKQYLNEQIQSKFFSPNWLAKCYSACHASQKYFLKVAMKVLKTKINDIDFKKNTDCYMIENFKYPNNSLKKFNKRLLKKVNQVLDKIDNNQEIVQEKESQYNHYRQHQHQQFLNSEHIEYNNKFQRSNPLFQTLFSESDENQLLKNDPHFELNLSFS